MNLSVRLFAGLKERFQTEKLSVSLEESSTVKNLIEQLAETYPDHAQLLMACMVAVNQEYAEETRVIRNGDEIALIPPVSGGEADPFITVTTEPLSADRLIRLVSNPYSGAVLTFVGTVREFTSGVDSCTHSGSPHHHKGGTAETSMVRRTTYLKYEAYETMAIKKMRQIAEEIEQKWDKAKVAIAHRIGELDIEEISVIIAVATPHRPEAFEAGRYAIERLKQIVPIWKKEVWEDGSEWIGHQLGTPWNPREDLPQISDDMKGK